MYFIVDDILGHMLGKHNLKVDSKVFSAACCEFDIHR
jgi:hypothetical protein